MLSHFFLICPDQNSITHPIVFVASGNSLSCFLYVCVCERETESDTKRKKSIFKIFIYLFVFGSTGSSLLRGLVCSCDKWVLLSGCDSLASYCEANIPPWAVDANVASFFFPILISEVLDIQDEEVSMAGKGSQHCPIILHSPMVIFPFFP